MILMCEKMQTHKEHSLIIVKGHIPIKNGFISASTNHICLDIITLTET